MTLSAVPEPPLRPIPAIPLATRSAFPDGAISIEVPSTIVLIVVPVLLSPEPAVVTRLSTYPRFAASVAAVGEATLVIFCELMLRIPPTCKVLAIDTPPAKIPDPLPAVIASVVEVTVTAPENVLVPVTFVLPPIDMLPDIAALLFTVVKPPMTTVPLTDSPVNVPTLVIPGCAALTVTTTPDPPDSPEPMIPDANRSFPSPRASIEIPSTFAEYVVPL